MNKLIRLLLCVFFLNASVFGQDFSKMYDLCYPQLDEKTVAVFDLLKESNIILAKSAITEKRQNGENVETVMSVWPDDGAVLSRSKFDKMEMTVLCNPHGYFFDRSDIQYFENKKYGEGSLMRMRGAPLHYQSELGLLTCASFDYLTLLSNVVMPETESGDSKLDQFLVDEFIGKIGKFMQSVTKEDSTESFEISGVKLTITKRGLLISEIKLEAPYSSLSVRNTFVSSEEDTNYEAYVEDNFYVKLIQQTEGVTSFGFGFAERGGKVFLDFNENWSRFLYTSAKAPAQFGEAIVSINGENVSAENFKKIEESVLKGTKPLGVTFENGKTFTFKKIDFDTFECIENLAPMIKNDIFWE